MIATTMRPVLAAVYAIPGGPNGGVHKSQTARRWRVQQGLNHLEEKPNRSANEPSVRRRRCRSTAFGADEAAYADGVENPLRRTKMVSRMIAASDTLVNSEAILAVKITPEGP